MYQIMTGALVATFVAIFSFLSGELSFLLRDNKKWLALIHK
jgi:hypothetical protein